MLFVKREISHTRVGCYVILATRVEVSVWMTDEIFYNPILFLQRDFFSSDDSQERDCRFIQ